MKKILLNITERQKEALDEKAKQYGIPMSEFIRRILDMFLCQPNQKVTYTVEDSDTSIAVEKKIKEGLSND